MGGGRHRGMQVAEPDDGDPADEIEVRAPLVVPDPAPLAADDRDVGARIRRQDGRARCLPAGRGSCRSHGNPGRADRRPDAATCGTDGGHQLGDDPALEPAVVEARLGLVRVQDGRELPSSSTPGTSVRKRILSAAIPTASAAAASSALTLRALGERGDDRHTPLASAASTARGPMAPGRLRGRAPRPSRPQADLVAVQADRARPDRLADLRVDGRERLADDVEHVRGRHATAVHERRGRSSPLHLRRDLRARAVHDDDVTVRLGERGSDDSRCDAAAQLQRRRSRRVLRVELDVVVREVGCQVGGLAVTEPEVELDPAGGARQLGDEPGRRPAANTGVPSKATRKPVGIEPGETRRSRAPIPPRPARAPSWDRARRRRS